MQGQVKVRRDAGQVIAGDSITHIHKSSPSFKSHAVIAVAFVLGVVSAVYAICAKPAEAAPGLSTHACYYEGHAYSVGALARMGQLEKVCEMRNGQTIWIHG